MRKNLKRRRPWSINPDKPGGQHRDVGSGFRRRRCDGEQTHTERVQGASIEGGERRRVRKTGLETMEGTVMESRAVRDERNTEMMKGMGGGRKERT